MKNLNNTQVSVTVCKQAAKGVYFQDGQVESRAGTLKAFSFVSLRALVVSNRPE